MITHKTTYELLKKYWTGQISDSTITEVRDLFEVILDRLAYSISEENHKENIQRKRYGLKPRKRLSINKNFSVEVYKQLSDVKLGIEGETNKETSISYKQDAEVT